MNLGEPGPDDDTLKIILSAGVRVPDHGGIEPWRIQVLRGDAQRVFGKTCAAIFERENPDATAATIEAEHERPQRSPLLLVVGSHPDPHRFVKVPEIEQILSSAAVCQNILIATRALGFNAQWVTGWPAYHPEVRVALGHSEETRLVGFIHIGTAVEPPKERPRPQLETIVSEWNPTSS